jgi:putative peptidoglycan lipid II flippase
MTTHVPARLASERFSLEEGCPTQDPRLEAPGAPLSGECPKVLKGTRNKPRILGTVFVLAATMGLSKAVALSKDLVVAKSFGTSEALDAFLMALLFPALMSNVVAGSFNTALIPTYVRVRDTVGRKSAGELLSGMMGLNIAILATVSLLGLCVFPQLTGLVWPSLSNNSQHLVHSLFIVLVPSIALTGISTTLSAVLNAESSFAIPTLRTAITPIVTLAALIFLRERCGVHCLAIGMTLGLVFESCLLIFVLQRRHISPWPRWCKPTSEMKEVVRQYGSAAAAAVVLCGTNFVDQGMVATAGNGAVAALSYGYKVASIVLMVGTFAIGTAILPHFSEVVARRDWVGLLATLRRWSRFLMLASVGATILMVIFSGPIVRLLYERGHFTSQDTQLVSLVQQSYALQITPVILGTMVVRMISALRANQLLIYGALITLLLDIGCNVVLISKLGVPGVGLSNTIAYLGTFVFLAMMLRRLLREKMLGAARGQQH